MRDEAGGLIAPGAFIPIAERYGLMQEIDRWVVRHLFQVEGDRLRAWHPTETGDHADRDFVYSINLSGASLTDPTFLDFVREALLRYSIPGGSVAFEITETQIITHLDKAVEFIRALKDLGCRFLLDDFGSGMSSFGYLKHLPVDYLKIDGLFVKDILTDPIDLAMVKMINEIGHTMGLITIAEYVENTEILTQINEIGVDMAQGFGISKPAELAPTNPALQVAKG
jgi:EAL domain-containing protein (putative c-di-GMP-specific phosphodiesterase class I)